MTDRTYRLLFALLGLGALAVVLVVFVFGSPSGDTPPLPDALEAISPQPGSQVPRQTRVEIDLPVGYRAEMFIDNFRVPPSELRFVEGTGVYSWTPLKSSTIQWGPGPHQVLVRWEKIVGLPDLGEYSWSFRVF